MPDLLLILGWALPTIISDSVGGNSIEFIFSALCFNSLKAREWRS